MKQRLTALGRQLARLPVDPRIGRILLAADELDQPSSRQTALQQAIQGVYRGRERR